MIFEKLPAIGIFETLGKDLAFEEFFARYAF